MQEVERFMRRHGFMGGRPQCKVYARLRCPECGREKSSLANVLAGRRALCLGDQVMILPPARDRREA